VPISLAVSLEFREVMDESGVDDAIRGGGSTLQTIKIVESPPMHLGTSGGKRLGGRIRASEGEHLMARADEFLNDGRANEACSAGDEDTHVLVRQGNQCSTAAAAAIPFNSARA
jgi:hypothetical protein